MQSLLLLGHGGGVAADDQAEAAHVAAKQDIERRAARLLGADGDVVAEIQSAEDGFVADAQLVVAAGRRVGGAEGHARRDLLTGIEVHDVLDALHVHALQRDGIVDDLDLRFGLRAAHGAGLAVDGDKDRAHNGVSTGRERGRERAVQRELKQLRLCGGIAIGIAADVIGFRDAGAAVDFNGITVGTGVGAAVEAVIEITLIAPGDGQAAHAGVRHAHGLDLGADGRDLNGRGIQKNGRMLRGGLQCRLLFRFLREGRNGQRGQQAQGEQQAETTFFHGDLPFFLVMLKMREAMIFHIFMVF